MPTRRRQPKRKAGSAARRTQAAARQARRRPVVARLARAGISARAFVYLVLAWLTLELVLTGGRSPRADAKGVLEDLANRPGGPVLVILLGLGFVLYAGWRLLQALAGDDSVEGGAEALKRVGWGLIGVVYLSLASQSFAVAVEGRAGRRNPQSAVGAVIGAPGGRVALGLVGTGVVIGGIALALWAAFQRFEIFLPPRKLPGWAEVVAHVVGTAGNIVRGLVLAAIGSSLFVAGVVGSAHDAQDLNSGLRLMRHHSYGNWALGVVSLGFLAFSLMSALEAAYREL